MRRPARLLSILVFALVALRLARAEAHSEIQGNTSDHDLSTPFAITSDLFGFPDISIPAIQSFSFVVPSVQNNTSAVITLQVYLSKGLNSGNSALLSSTQIPIAGCTVSVPTGPATDLQATCSVSAADNLKLIGTGVISNLYPSQGLALGFASSGPASSLTFSSDNNDDQVTWNVTPGPPPGLAFVAGSGVTTQSYPISGFDDGVTASASTITGDWLAATASSQNAPTTVTIKVTPSGLLAPAIYSGAVTISDSSNNSIAVPIALTVLPGSTQYIQQGAKFSTAAMYQGVSVALTHDGNTALVGATGDSGGTMYGAAWTYNRSSVFWNLNPAAPSSFASIGEADEGQSVSLSADGSVFLSGGSFDNNGIGAAWVYGGPCAPAKLVGSNPVGSSEQGFAVALSADGLTAMVGGLNDNSRAGAVWVFVCSKGVWSQQGAKMIPNNAIGAAAFGTSVALSADGNTALIGGEGDNADAGAAWVFVRSGTTWTQQAKLVGESSGFIVQGASVALSGDGNTAVVGGPYDTSSFLGAAWVFTRSGSTWNSTGVKLVGSGSVGSLVREGSSVAISPDGSTIAIGGTGDNGNTGAVWVFTKSGGTWKQFGSKLTGSDAASPSNQGNVALSEQGSTVVFGGGGDNANVGAAWAFVLSGPAPTLSSINPTGTYVGGSAFTLTVNGANFLNGATVQWNGAPLPTTFVSSSQLTATVSAGLIATAGANSIAAVNPDGTPTVAATLTVVAPMLKIGSSHSGNFVYGEPAATYTLSVSNAAGAAPTNGLVTVTETPPTGMTLNSMTGGSEWTCASGGNTCTTTTALSPGASYSAITVTVRIAGNAVSPLVNQVSVSGGGSASASANDSTTIVTASPCDVTLNGQTSVLDIQQVIGELLGTGTPANDLNSDGKVNVVDAQVVLNAARTGVCSPH